MALVLFYIALVLLIGMLTAEYFGVSVVHHEAVADIVSEQEKKIRTIAKTSKHFASKIRFENFHKLVVRIVNFTKREIIYLKRRFDSQQPKFFVQVKKPNEAHKNSVSFFLRSVTEHKNSLKKKDL